MASGAGLRRRRLAGEPPAWLRPLLAPQLVAELVGEVGPAGGPDVEAELLDELEAEMATLPGVGRWALRLTGGRQRLAGAAGLATNAGLTADLARRGLVVTASTLAELRPLMERGNEGGTLVLAAALDQARNDPALDALRRDDEAAGVAGARLALLHARGRGWAVLVHDPRRSGLPPPAAEPAVAATELAPPRGRRLAAGAAVGLAGVAALVLLVLGLRSAGSTPGSPTVSQPSQTALASRPPAALGLIVPVRQGPAPSVRQQPASAADPRDGLTLLFGGIAQVANTAVDLGDTWTWAAGTWTRLSPPGSPSARHGAVLAPDLGDPGAGPGSFLLVGGRQGAVDLHDTWLWSGGGWRQLGGAAPAGTVVAMTADLAHGTLVLVTRDGAGALTYLRSAVGWIRTAAATPPLRLLADDAQQTVIGLAPQPGTLAGPAQTWRWSGAAWIEAHPATEPGFDVLTATLTTAPGAGPLLVQADFTFPVIVHGGTWTFDGRTWRHANGLVPDFVRAFDFTTPVWGLAGSDPVLIGGSQGDDAYRRAARWDGQAWTAL
ncbi:MAG TPA: hypothetical protein VI316_10920 [Candidatus Dormibacteraeota bacterium]